MLCDMCGSEDQLYKTMIEGTELNVCQKCSKFGKVIQKLVEPEPEIRKPETRIMPQETEVIEIITPEYSTIIRSKREKLGLKQKDFAKMIAEKESVVHKLESGQIRPSIKLARKLEKLLKVRLVEEVEEEPISHKTRVSEELTIGDMVKLK
jgi:putative transcription factor